MDTHLLSGYAVLTLLVFRAGWFLWGGGHSRWSAYRVSLRRLLGQLRGQVDSTAAHTPFGALLLLTLWALAAVQTTSGLFASDDIFTEGPLAHRLDDAGVDLATAIHTRLFWALVALVAGHLLAIAAYALRRHALVAAMFTGRKPGPPAESRQRIGAAIATLAGSAALVYALVNWA
jgi:cytochrome b